MRIRRLKPKRRVISAKVPKTAKRKGATKANHEWSPQAEFLRAVILAGYEFALSSRAKMDDKEFDALVIEQLRGEKPVSLTVSSIIIPEKKTAEGVLIESTSFLWTEIVSRLQKDWNAAYLIPPEKWEEIIAGAFHKAGYDKVTLTPRSGDYGRDVIAIRSGVGCVKIIGSVKAYAPHRRVGQDDVRALLGVLTGESNASKGMITTTADFASRIRSDPFIKPFLPTRLELVNGEQLRAWLTRLLKSR